MIFGRSGTSFSSGDLRTRIFCAFFSNHLSNKHRNAIAALCQTDAAAVVFGEEGVVPDDTSDEGDEHAADGDADEQGSKASEDELECQRPVEAEQLDSDVTELDGEAVPVEAEEQVGLDIPDEYSDSSASSCDEAGHANHLPRGVEAKRAFNGRMNRRHHMVSTWNGNHSGEHLIQVADAYVHTELPMPTAAAQLTEKALNHTRVSKAEGVHAGLWGRRARLHEA